MTDKLELELRREIAELRGRIVALESTQTYYIYPQWIGPHIAPYTQPLPWWQTQPTCASGITGSVGGGIEMPLQNGTAQ